MNINTYRPLIALLVVLVWSSTGCQAAPEPAAGNAPPSVETPSAETPSAVTPATWRDEVFDVPALLNTPLEGRTLQRNVKDGIVTEEIMYHSEVADGKKVDIFGYFSYPEGARKLPAFIWNQAGAARASTYFTELGARRGYAALCIDLPIAGYRSTGWWPINSGLQLTEDPRQAPIYHGAVALLKAVSYLQSREEVDPQRIGMAGSSWGGFFTTLMIGLDSRLKAGSAMFGTGSLQLGNNWSTARPDADWARRWRVTLDPAWRLQWSRTPMAWFTGTNDFAYWMPSLMQTYAMTKDARKHLTLLPNWDHGLTPTLDDQVFVWLDVWLKGAPAFLQQTPLQIVREQRRLRARWNFTGPRRAVAAEIMLSYGETGNWHNRHWLTLPARMEINSCVADLPHTRQPYWVSGAVLDSDGYRYSTPLVLVKPATWRVQLQGAVTNYNGASLWGDWEAPQIAYLDANSWAHPPVAKGEAHRGKDAVSLAPGTHTLPRLYFTSSVPHRLTAWAKSTSANPVSIKMRLEGLFDGQASSVEAVTQVSDRWTPITLQIVPPEALATRLLPVIEVPQGATVLVDDLIFIPTATGLR